MKRSTALKHSPLTLGLTLGLALSLGLAPLPLLAASPALLAASPARLLAPAEASDAPAEDAAPAKDAAQVGGNVAILKFTGDDYQASDYRGRIQAALQAQGYTANFIKRSITEAADRNKCRDLDAACLEKIGAYVNKNSKTEYDFYLWADIPASGGLATIAVYDIEKNQKIVELDVATSANDFILAEVIGAAVARRVAETQVEPSPATEEEQQIIATLDEPAETPEEIERRERELAEAAEKAGQLANANLEAGEQTVDLRDDFKDFCRTGPRKDKEIENEAGEVTKERDLRPPCKRGPVFGYWQPRAYVALGLTIASAAGMGLMYGLAASSRSDWRAAKDNLVSSGLSSTDPNNACDGGTCYSDLAAEVSNATGQIRRRAITGDVLLGTTVLLAGVLAIIIYQDRQDAKTFIKTEKELRALSNLRIAPMFGRTNGAAMSFEF